MMEAFEAGVRLSIFMLGAGGRPGRQPRRKVG